MKKQVSENSSEREACRQRCSGSNGQSQSRGAPKRGVAAEGRNAGGDAKISPSEGTALHVTFFDLRKAVIK